MGETSRVLRAESSAGNSLITHPAKFSNNILGVCSQLLDPSWMVLDNFAGTGRIHQIHANAWGVEIEPEWASLHPRTIVGDALRLPFRDCCFDAACTSPTYANRLADAHNAKDGSIRHSYTHDLGRKLHPNNSGQLQWGEAYRRFHEAAWLELYRVLKLNGTFLLNVSNHIRKGVEVDVVGWHQECLESIGFRLDCLIGVPTGRLRFGRNGTARVDREVVMVWERL